MNKKTFAALAAILSISTFAFGGSKLIVKDGDSIAFLGDSITQFGNEPNGYVNMVMKGLEVLGVKDAVKIPAGIGGHKSNNMLERVDRDCLSKKPTFMTVSCGVNDVWHGNNGVPLDQYQKNMSAIFDKAAASNVTVIVLTPTLIGEDVENGANKTLLGYVDWLKAEAKRRRLIVADLNKEMRDTLARIRKEAEAGHKTLSGNLLTKDGVHMAFEGDCMMAWGVLKAFGAKESDRDLIYSTFRRFPNVRYASVALSAEEYDDLLAAAADRPLAEFLHDRLFTDGKQAEVPVCDEEIVSSIITNMLPVPGCKFLAGRTEITQKQWDAVCKDITYFVFPGESNPAHNVSWNDCRKFIYILNQQKIVREAGLHFRLPSEWEWEYVAAAGGKGSFGKTAAAPEGNPVEMGWISDNAERHPHPVALKTPNAWGFHDMHGNVWEWTTTSFDAGNLYVLKGGSWQGGSVPSSIKYRISYHPPYRGQTLGLRLFADKYEE